MVPSFQRKLESRFAFLHNQKKRDASLRWDDDLRDVYSLYDRLRRHGHQPLYRAVAEGGRQGDRRCPRASPLRKKGFSKNVLKSRLEKEGIAYLHFKALGTPKPGRDAARAGRYEEFIRLFHSHLKSVEAQVELESLMLSASKTPTCLLCFERDPALCHRSILAARLEARGLDVVDLFA